MDNSLNCMTQAVEESIPSDIKAALRLDVEGTFLRELLNETTQYKIILHLKSTCILILVTDTKKKNLPSQSIGHNSS